MPNYSVSAHITAPRLSSIGESFHSLPSANKGGVRCARLSIRNRSHPYTLLYNRWAPQESALWCMVEIGIDNLNY